MNCTIKNTFFKKNKTIFKTFKTGISTLEMPVFVFLLRGVIFLTMCCTFVLELKIIEGFMFFVRRKIELIASRTPFFIKS